MQDSQTIMSKKSKAGMINIQDPKKYYRALVIKTWYWLKKRCEDQWNKTKDTNMSICNFIHLIFDKDNKNKTKTKTHKLEKRKPLYQMVPGKLEAHLQKYEIRLVSIILHKK